MERETGIRQKLFAFISQKWLKQRQKITELNKRERERRHRNKNRRQQSESPRQGSSWWIYVVTIVLLLFLGFLLFLTLFHILYRARQSSGEAKLYEWLLCLRPYLDWLIPTFWRTYTWLSDLFGMNGADENSRLAIANAVRFVLTPLGIASIMLGYINSAKSMEIVGFSVRTIIERRYPWRIAFYFLQGVFVLLGIYTAVRGWLFSAAQCLLGALLCFVYSVNLAYRVVISRNALLRSARHYIDAHVRSAKRRARHGGKEAQQLYNEAVFLVARHVARHLSQRYMAGELFQAEDSRAGIDFCYFVSLLNQLCIGDSETSTKRRKDEECGPNDCFSSFRSCFATKSALDATDLEYAVLYDLPVMNENTAIFGRGIRACQELWELMLEPVKDLRQRAALARHLLCVAAGRCHNFPLLLCGLAAYMRAQLDPTKERPGEGFEEGAYERFLCCLTYGQAQPALATYELTVASESRCNMGCGDLAFILMCMLALEEALSERGNAYQRRQSFCTAISKVYRDYCRNGASQSGFYLAYAYLILKTLNLRAAPHSTWLELSFSLPMIRQQLEKLL